MNMVLFTYYDETVTFILGVLLERRIRQHQSGDNYTKKHRPVVLVYYQEFPTIGEAFRRDIPRLERFKFRCLLDKRFLDWLSHLSSSSRPRSSSLPSGYSKQWCHLDHETLYYFIFLLKTLGIRRANSYRPDFIIMTQH